MTIDNEIEGKRRGRPMPLWIQLLVVAACFAVVAGIVAAALLWPSGSPSAAPASPGVSSSRVTLTPAQLKTLQIVPVSIRQFRTKIVTDGYITPGGGAGKSEAPILGGQSGDILQAETDLMTASGQLRLAQANEARQHALYLADSAALKDWQQSQADQASARAALASARNRLRILGRSDAAIAAVEHSDMGGATAGPSFSIRDFSALWVVANVREADIGDIKTGDPISVVTPAFPGKVFQGSVSFIGAMVDPVSHRLQVAARLQNPGKLLKPNMQATVTLFGADQASAPAVPSAAVIYDGSDARVWTVGPGNTLLLREVSVGRQDGDYSEITRGVSANERIVAGGALFIDHAASTD